MNGQPLLKPLRDNWILIAAFAALASGWGTTTYRVAHAEEELTEVEKRVVAIEKDLGAVRESLVRVEVNQDHTDEDLSEMKSYLTEILRELRED